MSELLRGKSDLEAEIALCDREIERCRAACAVDKHAAIGECDWRVERNILLEQSEGDKDMEREESGRVLKEHLDVLEALLSRDIDEGDNILSQEEVEAIDAGAKALKAMQVKRPRKSEQEKHLADEKQRHIDVSNLRFYADMFRQHCWSTVVIHWGVFEQTLREIAQRIEQSHEHR